MKDSSDYNDTLLHSRSLELLDFYVCGIIDFPRSGVDCSQRDPSQCFKCRFRTAYISDESINDYQSVSHWTCRMLATSVIILGLLGMLTNEVVVMTIRIRRHHVKRSFDFLLCALSHVDNLCCFSCVTYALAHLAYFDNWFNREKITMYWIYFSSTIMILGRAPSVYLTLLISLERYLAITCPLRFRAWYSISRTKLQLALVIGVTTLIIFPALPIVRLYVGPNIYRDVPSFRGFRYMFLPTRVYNLLEANVALVVFIYVFQYWIPVPIILALNILSYKKVKLLSKERRILTSSQQKELQPIKMFFPVVIVYLCTNLLPMLMQVLLHVWSVNFREIWMAFSLVTTVNSSVNFWIYFFRCATFRREAQSLFTGWILNLKDSMFLHSWQNA